MTAELRRLERIERGLVASLELVREQIAAERRRIVVESDRAAEVRAMAVALRRAEARATSAEERLAVEQRRTKETKAECDRRLAEDRQSKRTVAKAKRAQATAKTRAEREAKAKADRAAAVALAKRTAAIVAEAASEHFRTPITVAAMLQKGSRGKAKDARSALIFLCLDRVGLTKTEVAVAINTTPPNIHGRYNYGMTLAVKQIYERALAKINAGALAEAA